MPLEFRGEPIDFIVLPESITIFMVKAIHDKLLSLDINTSVTLDFTKTTEVDTAGVQLLLAFVQHHKKSANPVKFINVSEEIQSALTLLGAGLTNTSNKSAGGACDCAIGNISD